MAQETLERTKAATKETARKVDERASAGIEGLRELSLSLIDMAHANVDSAFEFAREATTLRTPVDIINLWTSHSRKQLELLSEQSKRMTELGQKLATRTAPSIAPQD
jgi:hypothetical protein